MVFHLNFAFSIFVKIIATCQGCNFISEDFQFRRQSAAASRIEKLMLLYCKASIVEAQYIQLWYKKAEFNASSTIVKADPYQLFGRSRRKWTLNCYITKTHRQYSLFEKKRMSIS